MDFFKKVLDIILTKQVLGTVIVLVGATILIKASNKLISHTLIKGKTTYEVKRRTTIVKLFQSLFRVLIWAIAILIILDFFGVNTKSLITSLGVVGVVLGLALQDTVKDFISGVSMVLENYLAVGDIVTYNGFTGEVIELGLRVTKIKKFSGEVLVVANRNIDSIINESQKKADVYLEIDTAYEADTKTVEKILNDVLKEAIKDKLILPESKYMGINELSSSSVKYMIDVHCDQNKKYQIKRDMLGRIKKAYDKAGIKIPYPQIEVHHGQDI